MGTKRGGFCPPLVLSEANRITIKIYYLARNLVTNFDCFGACNTIKNREQIITIISTIQQGNHHFFGHGFVLNRVEILGLTDATLTCPECYLSEVIIEGKV